MKNKSNFYILLTFLFITLIFSANVVAQDNQKTLIFAVNSPTNNLDPAIGSSVPEMRLFLASYEALVRFKPGTLELEPVLALSWSSNDDKSEYTFELREGVKFHDGAEFNAEAVKASYERNLEIGQGESYLINDIENIVVEGPYTVTMQLSAPNPEFLYSVTRQFIVSPKAVEENEKNGDLAKDWFARNEAGTGPYTLNRWEEDQEYEYVKFDEYWRGWRDNNFEKVIFKIVVEPATQELLIKRGEIDVAENIVEESLDELSKLPGIRVDTRETPNPFYISMNMERSPLDNIKVRQAIVHALDYETTIEMAMTGYASYLNGPVPTGFPGYNDELPEISFDLEKAKELLEEAGYPNGGFTLTYMYLEHWLFEQTVGLILQQGLNELGIELDIQAQPWATMTAKMKDPDERPDLVMYAQTTPTPSPLTILRPMYHSESEHWSHFTYSNPEVDKLLEDAGKIADDEERHQAYEEIQRLVFEDYPQLFVFDRNETLVFRDNIKNTKTLITWTGRMFNYYEAYKE